MRTSSFTTIPSTPAAVDDWRNASLCSREPPELFFPVGKGGSAQTQVLEAKAVCLRCVVRERCLSWALESDVQAGVWGGLDEDERRAARRRRH